ncbi:hypothetical protein [Escherichia coli]
MLSFYIIYKLIVSNNT